MTGFSIADRLPGSFDVETEPVLQACEDVVRELTGCIALAVDDCPEELAGKINYPTILGANAWGLELCLGYSETLCSYDTYQFTDYSRYEANAFNESDKAKRRDEQFPKDLQNAFELGKRLVAKAKELNALR